MKVIIPIKQEIASGLTYQQASNLLDKLKPLSSVAIFTILGKNGNELWAVLMSTKSLINEFSRSPESFEIERDV
jgi:hypothetical protein